MNKEYDDFLEKEYFSEDFRVIDFNKLRIGLIFSDYTGNLTVKELRNILEYIDRISGPYNDFHKVEDCADTNVNVASWDLITDISSTATEFRCSHCGSISGFRYAVCDVCKSKMNNPAIM